MNKSSRIIVSVLLFEFPLLASAQFDPAKMLQQMQKAVDQMEKKTADNESKPKPSNSSPSNQPSPQQVQSPTQGSQIEGAMGNFLDKFESRAIADLRKMGESDRRSSGKFTRESSINLSFSPQTFDGICASTDKFASIGGYNQAFAEYATAAYRYVAQQVDKDTLSKKAEFLLMFNKSADCSGRTVKQLADFIWQRAQAFRPNYENALQANQKDANDRKAAATAEAAAEEDQRRKREEQQRLAAEQRQKEEAAAEAKKKQEEARKKAAHEARLVEINKNNRLAKSCYEVVESMMFNKVPFTDGLLPSIQPTKQLKTGFGVLDLFDENKVFAGGSGYVNGGKGVYAQIKTSRTTAWLQKENIRIGEEVVIIGKYVENSKLKLANGSQVQAPVLELTCISPGP